MTSGDYPSVIGKCVAKPCTYSVQLFETSMDMKID
jgi:hypothetical protein